MTFEQLAKCLGNVKKLLEDWPHHQSEVVNYEILAAAENYFLHVLIIFSKIFRI